MSQKGEKEVSAVGNQPLSVFKCNIPLPVAVVTLTDIGHDGGCVIHSNNLQPGYAKIMILFFTENKQTLHMIPVFFYYISCNFIGLNFSF